MRPTSFRKMRAHVDSHVLDSPPPTLDEGLNSWWMKRVTGFEYTRACPSPLLMPCHGVGSRRSQQMVVFASGPIFVSISPRLHGCHMPQNQTVVVVEPPLNYKLIFDGPTNGGLAKPLVNANPVSMALFPHVQGASVCAPLYDHYVAEDGVCYHL